MLTAPTVFRDTGGNVLRNADGSAMVDNGEECATDAAKECAGCGGGGDFDPCPDEPPCCDAILTIEGMTPCVPPGTIFPGVFSSGYTVNGVHYDGVELLGSPNGVFTFPCDGTIPDAPGVSARYWPSINMDGTGGGTPYTQSAGWKCTGTGLYFVDSLGVTQDFQIGVLSYGDIQNIQCGCGTVIESTNQTGAACINGGGGFAWFTGGTNKLVYAGGATADCACAEYATVGIDTDTVKAAYLQAIKDFFTSIGETAPADLALTFASPTLTLSLADAESCSYSGSVHWSVDSASNPTFISDWSAYTSGTLYALISFSSGYRYKLELVSPTPSICWQGAKGGAILGEYQTCPGCSGTVPMVQSTVAVG